MLRLDSGADHERVSAANPQWSEFDWCRYWELDARKAYRRAGVTDPGRKMDCGDPQCKCKGMNK